MMCSASSRPTISSASKLVMQQGAGIKPFFAGVGPRALSNGLNSAVFFCFFEALRGVRPSPPYTSPVLFKNWRLLAKAVLSPVCVNLQAYRSLAGRRVHDSCSCGADDAEKTDGGSVRCFGDIEFWRRDSFLAARQAEDTREIAARPPGQT